MSDGRRFRILAVVDDGTRECLALVADTSISGIRVARELDRIVAVRGRPGGIVSDNGTELTSTAILAWSDRQKVAWHYIAPGKPVQNAFIADCATSCSTKACSAHCRTPAWRSISGAGITTPLHHTHLPMSLKRKDFVDQAAVPRGVSRGSA